VTFPVPEQELIPATSDHSQGWGRGVENWPGWWIYGLLVCTLMCWDQLSVNTWSPYQRSVYETQLLEWQKILCC